MLIFARALKDQGTPIPQIATKLTITTGRTPATTPPSLPIPRPAGAAVEPARPLRCTPAARGGLSYRSVCDTQARNLWRVRLLLRCLLRCRGLRRGGLGRGLFGRQRGGAHPGCVGGAGGDVRHGYHGGELAGGDVGDAVLPAPGPAGGGRGRRDRRVGGDVHRDGVHHRDERLGVEVEAGDPDRAFRERARAGDDEFGLHRCGDPR